MNDCVVMISAMLTKVLLWCIRSYPVALQFKSCVQRSNAGHCLMQVEVMTQEIALKRMNLNGVKL